MQRAVHARAGCSRDRGAGQKRRNVVTAVFRLTFRDGRNDNNELLNPRVPCKLEKSTISGRKSSTEKFCATQRPRVVSRRLVQEDACTAQLAASDRTKEQRIGAAGKTSIYQWDLPSSIIEHDRATTDPRNAVAPGSANTLLVRATQGTNEVRERASVCDTTD